MNQLLENLPKEYAEEIRREFAGGLRLWRRIPESSVAKSVGIIEEGVRERRELIAMILERVAYAARLARLAERPPTERQYVRAEWDELLTGDRALWGKRSVFAYYGCAALRDMAKTFLKKCPSAEEVMRFCDGIDVPAEVIRQMSLVSRPRWREIAIGIRRVFERRVGWRESKPWAELSFERSLTGVFALRAEFDKTSDGFGFDYRFVICTDGKALRSIAYERDLRVGVGRWDRVSDNGLQDAMDVLDEVTRRVESMVASALGSGERD